MNAIARIRRWREEVNASKQKFVWQFGVLGFGLTFGLYMAIYQQVTDIAGMSPLARTLAFVLMMFGVGPITGWLWGQIMWPLRSWWASQPSSDPPSD
jgi:hypothetical protein